MDLVLVVVKLVLAAVFSVAGVAKLSDRVGAQQSLKDFGVPSALAPLVGFLLPFVELGIAIALLSVATAWWGAVGACALLLLFIASLSAALAVGRRPDCQCFGRLSPAPIGWTTLARNLLLAVAAAFIVLQGPEGVGPSALSWITGLTPLKVTGAIFVIVVLGVMAVEGWLLVHVLRQNGRLLLRVEVLESRLDTGGAARLPDQNRTSARPAFGLPLGAPAPNFSLPSLSGETLTLEDLRARGKPVMLVFSDPHCGPCNGLMPEINHWQRDHTGVTIAIVSQGTPEANRVGYSLSHFLLQEGREIAEAFQVPGTPSAVIIRPDGTIGSPVAAGPSAIRELVGKPNALVTASDPPQIPQPSSYLRGYQPRLMDARRNHDLVPEW